MNRTTWALVGIGWWGISIFVLSLHGPRPQEVPALTAVWMIAAVFFPTFGLLIVGLGEADE